MLAVLTLSSSPWENSVLSTSTSISSAAVDGEMEKQREGGGGEKKGQINYLIETTERKILNSTSVSMTHGEVEQNLLSIRQTLKSYMTKVIAVLQQLKQINLHLFHIIQCDSLGSG